METKSNHTPWNKGKLVGQKQHTHEVHIQGAPIRCLVSDDGSVRCMVIGGGYFKMATQGLCYDGSVMPGSKHIGILG